MELAGYTVLELLLLAIIFLLVHLPVAYLHMSDRDPISDAWDALSARW